MKIRGEDIKKRGSSLLRPNNYAIFLRFNNLCVAGVKIHSNATGMLSGNDMKLYAEGANGETPFTFAALGVQYVWSSDNPSVIEIVPLATNVATDILLYTNSCMLRWPHTRPSIWCNSVYKV